MVPMLGLSDQLTAVLLVFTTVATNCRLSLVTRVALVGKTEIETGTIGGFKVMVAVAVLEGSAMLVAVAMTVCVAVTLAGAVYTPAAVMEPTLGLIDQVTAVLLVPATLAVKVWVWPPKRDALGGNTEMVTQASDTGLNPRSVPEFSNFMLT
jgi:hypothetical protein